MLAGAVVIVAAILAGLIQRGRSDADSDLRRARWILALVCVCVIGVTLVCVLSRGWSNASVILMAAALLLVGVAFVVAAKPSVSRTPVTTIVVTEREASALVLTAAITTVVVAILWVLVPLRYAGAFESDPKVERFIAHFVPDAFDPLTMTRELAAGQCLARREVLDENTVVPCSHPHRAEAIQEVGWLSDCPTAEVAAAPGTEMPLEVVVAGPWDGIYYCILRPVDPTRSFERQVMHTLPAAA